MMPPPQHLPLFPPSSPPPERLGANSGGKSIIAVAAAKSLADGGSPKCMSRRRRICARRRVSDWSGGAIESPFLARRWWGLLWDRGSWEKFRGRGHATGVGRMAGKSSHVPGVMHHPGRAPQHPCSHSAPAKAAGPGRDSSERKGRSLSPSRAKLLL